LAAPHEFEFADFVRSVVIDASNVDFERPAADPQKEALIAFLNSL
jgi:hypothetical protein